MKTPLITLLAVALGLSVSCKEKSPEVKKVENATEDAVASGKMTKDEAKAVNDIAQKADEMKTEAGNLAREHLAALDKAVTAEEMKAAVKDATKANIDLATKSGLMVKEQAELALKSIDQIDVLPEPALKQAIEQLKIAFKQMQEQAGK
ncbi:hypothetical protein JIN84_12070 [Luteolibacter yonseiensis]|uniref:Lipoprotein n=1 Tax=Luteolibacter yonseiensis TaxID=1144680 RepID=A0A934VAM6_9BACT|nr:hypothetical protein [Luteolibacter yonseiensis]MBK1816353.1 hypothetical protein [Luteolibacter yonseiensis]